MRPGTATVGNALPLLLFEEPRTVGSTGGPLGPVVVGSGVTGVEQTVVTEAGEMSETVLPILPSRGPGSLVLPGLTGPLPSQPGRRVTETGPSRTFEGVPLLTTSFVHVTLGGAPRSGPSALTSATRLPSPLSVRPTALRGGAGRVTPVGTLGQEEPSRSQPGGPREVDGVLVGLE